MPRAHRRPATWPSLPTTPPNYGSQRLFEPGNGVQYSDDSLHRQPEAIKSARAVACLYFAANEPWSPGMGGETGVFLPDGVTLANAVPPKNNLLLAFEISPNSFHAYQGSTTMQRNSFIWWYHSPPGYLLARHRGGQVADREAEPRDELVAVRERRLVPMVSVGDEDLLGREA